MQLQRLTRIPIEILRARVAQEIRTAILRGDLPPGTGVDREDLAEQLGVPREPLRQALLTLEREGLVLEDRNRRVRVAPVDPQLISDVYEFREAVEITAVVTLARLARFDVSPLRDIVARGRVAARQGDLPALVHLDMSFHTSVCEAAGNQVVVEAFRGQWSDIRRVMAMVLQRVGQRQRVWDQHEAIVEAIAAGRVASAIAAAGRHIRSARRVLLRESDSASGASGEGPQAASSI